MPAICETVRSNCGQARATYRPDWTANFPWHTYVRGTAIRCFPTERGALSDLERRGFSFSKLIRY